MRILTTYSPFLSSTISDSKTSKSKKNKILVPDTIPQSLVNRLAGVLEDSSKWVKKNARKNSLLNLKSSMFYYS